MEMVYDEEEEEFRQNQSVEDEDAKQVSFVEQAPQQPRPQLPKPRIESKDEVTPLEGSEIWNVSFCLLAWAFAVCNVTLGSYGNCRQKSSSSNYCCTIRTIDSRGNEQCHCAEHWR